jgi:hypothetical protein
LSLPSPGTPHILSTSTESRNSSNGEPTICNGCCTSILAP